MARVTGSGLVPVRILEVSFVDVAPLPVLPFFKGLDDRVFGSVEMLGGVLIFGAVAAADVAAGQAFAQIYPFIAGFQTLFAAFRSARLNMRVDLIKMRAGFFHMALA